MTIQLLRPPMNLQRLNKVLSRHGLCSRRKADVWIASGRVTVDGIVCRELGTQVDPSRQRIAVDGKTLSETPDVYYIVLNKPEGVVTTRNDPQGRKTVLDLLPDNIVEAGVFPVGRLDYASEGLLLLTNDGDWSQILLHPRHQFWKEYLVETDRALTLELRKQLEKGIVLDGKKTLPSRISIPDSGLPNQTKFVIAIREGRNRQIRRMCQAIGLSVRTLKRLKMGPIHLGELEKGEWRLLQKNEVEAVRTWEHHETSSPQSNFTNSDSTNSST